MRLQKTPSERFHNKIFYEPNTGCWLWGAALCRDGYARFDRRIADLAHRYSYALYKGPIPDNLEIDHLCKVRCCVNPSHLEAVTHAENVRRGDYKSNHRNKVKTHCTRGHGLSGRNLIIKLHNGKKRRNCRTCFNSSQVINRKKRTAQKAMCVE